MAQESDPQRGRKELPVAAAGLAKAGASGSRESREDEGVLGAAGRGFARGVLTGAQSELSARRRHARDPEEQEEVETPARRRQPAPETRQPPSLDVIDVIQGNPTPDVVMHPSHIAGLKALEGNGDDGLESGGAGYGR